MAELDKVERVYIDRATRLREAISALEGWAFGEKLRFSTMGYVEQLSIDLGGWKDIDGFREIPGLREFAETMNAATKPVREAYAKQLRQELANECSRLAVRALSGTN